MLVAGGVCGDASILSAQIAARCIKDSQRVLFISCGQGDSRSLKESVFANLTGWPHDRIKYSLSFDEGEGLLIPYDATRDPEFTRRALPFANRYARCMDFHFRPDFRDSPLVVLEEYLSGSEVPNCLIVDDVQISGIKVDGIATAVMKRLARYSSEKGIPVVVTCQQKPEAIAKTRKRVGTQQISDIYAVGNQCDVFIGISQLRSSEAVVATKGPHSSSQFLNVHGTDGTTKFPVSIDFDTQQFIAREEYDVTKDEELAMRAAMMVLDSDRNGYVMFRRDVFLRLCALEDPRCINVYAFCLLAASYERGRDYGTMFYGYDTIGDLLGIERRRVKKIIGLLVEANLMECLGKRKQTYHYRIVDYEASQNPNESGYFMLARNLLDPGRKGLLVDPLLLRVWLGCIYAAMFSADVDFLERGQLMRKPHELADLLGDKPGDVEWAIAELLETGRMEELFLDFTKTSVLEITNYEIYQYGQLYRKDLAAKMARSFDAKPVPNACQTNAK